MSCANHFTFILKCDIIKNMSRLDRQNVCSQFIYSIYIYLYLGLLLIAAKNVQGYLSAQSSNIILKFVAEGAAEHITGPCWSHQPADTTMGHHFSSTFLAK